MSFTFNEENEKKFQALLKRYPKKDSLTLPSLWMVQYQEGWINEDALVYIAQRLDKSPMDIYSIASFYTMFNLKQIGKYHFQMCKTLSCMLNGSENILNHLENRLGIKAGQTTKDMKFTISKVECLGACGGGPCMSLNDTYHENLTVQKIDDLLEELEK